MPKIKLRFNTALLLIILLGLILRLVGTSHGFPFIFHDDEPALVRSAVGLRFAPNPGHFDWPHLHFYLNFVLHLVYIKFRGGLQLLNLQGPISSVFPLMWRDPLIFYFLSRAFNAFIGAATAIPLYLAGKKLFNKKVGLLAALSITVMPYHVYTSHFALIDIPMAFWVAWVLYFCIRIFLDGDLRSYLWAGFFVGFAASTKYNGAIVALMVPTAHLLRVFGAEKIITWKGFKTLFLSGVLAAFGFLLGTPYAVLDYATFSITDNPRGAFWQFENVGAVSLSEQIVQFVEVLTFEFAYNFGYVFIALYTLTVLYAVAVKRTRRLWLILFPSLLMFFYVSGFSKTRAHYYTMVYPFVAIISGIAISSLLDKISGATKKKIILSILFLIPFWFSVQSITRLVRDDTRVQMYKWMLENVSESDYIFYNSTDMRYVLEKFSENRASRGVDIAELAENKGYILLGFTTEEFEEFELGLHRDSFVGEMFEKEIHFNNDGRRGSHILIYEFGKAKEN